MKTQKIRVGLLGAGYISSWHAAALRRNPHVEVSAVCDLSNSAAKSLAAASGGAKVFTSLNTLLDAEICDVIHVLTPPNAHSSNAAAIIAAGVHVFLEKPAALSAQECLELENLASQKNVRIAVNHNFLMLPSYDRLKRDLDNKRIGPIDTIEINWQFPLPPLRSGPYGIWMLREPKNILFEIGSHLFAFVADLFDEFREINLRLKHPITIPGGVTHFQSWQITGVSGDANVTVNLSLVEGHDNRSVTIRGAGAAVKFDFANDLYRFEQASMKDIVLGPLALQVDQSRQAFGAGMANAFRQLKSLNAHAPYGLSISRSIDAFYAALANEEILDRRLSIGAAAHSTAHIEAVIRAAKFDIERAQQNPVNAVRTTSSENGETVLVIGGSGFIGRYLVTALADKGYRVRVFSRGAGGGLERPDGRVTVYTGDLKSQGDLRNAMADVAAVYHLARATEDSWAGYVDNDVNVTRGIGEAAIAAGVNRFIYTGTIDSYDASSPDQTIHEETPFDENLKQRNLYARSKAACEAELKSLSKTHSLPLTIIRPGIVIGRGGPLQHWGIAMWRGATACKLWGDGKNKLPFVLADDVAEGMVLALQSSDAVGRSFNLIGDPMLSAKEYFDAVGEANAVMIRAQPTPIWTYYTIDVLKYWAKKLLAKKTGLTKPNFRDWKSRAQLSLYDNSLSKGLLGWRPESDPDRFIQRGIVDANLFGFIDPDPAAPSRNAAASAVEPKTEKQAIA